MTRTNRLTRSLRALAAAGALGACATTGSATLPMLENVDWRLASLGGAPAVPTEGPNAARLRFVADSGRVVGGGGCNRLSGPYTLAGDSLRMSRIVSTRMACLDERLNAQEVAFLRALDETRRYRVAGDTLTLLGDGGALVTLVTVRAP